MNGERLGKELARFKEAQWFDSHLPDGDRFVVNCCIAIEFAFQTRIDDKATELAQLVTNLNKKKCSSVDPIEKLASLLPELIEIDKFLSIVAVSDHPSLLASECTRHLEEHAGYLDKWANTITQNWIADIDAKKLDTLYSLA